MSRLLSPKDEVEEVQGIEGLPNTGSTTRNGGLTALQTI